MGAGIYFGNNCGISVDDEQAQNDYQVIYLNLKVRIKIFIQARIWLYIRTKWSSKYRWERTGLGTA